MSYTYKNAGVDIDRGDALVESIKTIAAKTQRPEVVSGIGGFGGLFQVPLDRYKNPVMVAGTDGVGTKLKLALQYNKHAGIGFDLVAMCVNDVLCSGAEPLFFLDYFATSRLDLNIAREVLTSIGEACCAANITLLGGETAEMPGFYQGKDYDVAGFVVGMVEKDAILTGDKVSRGDVFIGIGSSGPHSNGYSLIRQILTEQNVDVFAACGAGTLLDALLAPTHIYVKAIQALEKTSVHAIANITGGGITENLPRVLPEHLAANVHTQSWPRLPVFDVLIELGQLEPAEFYRTFNAGLGMILVAAPENAASIISTLANIGYPAWVVGDIVPQTATPKVNYIHA